MILLCVLLGGFVGWGTWEYLHPVFRIRALKQEEIDEFMKAPKNFQHAIVLDDVSYWWHSPFTFTRTITAPSFPEHLEHLYDLPQSVIDAKLEEVKKISSL